MGTGRVAPALCAALAMLLAASAGASAKTLPLSELGYPDCPDTLVPQASADGMGGGRTITDYVLLCTGATAQVADDGGGLRAEFGTVLLLVIGVGIVLGIGLAWYVRYAWEP